MLARHEQKLAKPFRREMARYVVPNDREWFTFTLVADGRSNSEIAEQLFISRKTASVHVSNILAKLGVATRVQAAAVAHRRGLTRAPADS